MIKIKSIQKPKILVIIGPTASGKSSLAIDLARHFNGEVISADSRQVYKGMDIGTGKVTKKEQWLVPHHGLDLVNPKKQYSAADFKSYAQAKIADIVGNKKLPVICGGTGLYMDSVVYDLTFPEVAPDLKFRAKLEKQSAEQLYTLLKKQDPRRAETIDRHNKRRLIRALEIIKAIGVIASLDTNYANHTPQYQTLWLGLNPKNLDARIKKRLDLRFKQGMVNEVKKLHEQGISWKRLNDFGLEYRWISLFLQRKISNQEMKSGLYAAIRQYAKRQMTWFKRNKNIHWLTEPKQAKNICAKFLWSTTH